MKKIILILCTLLGLWIQTKAAPTITKIASNNNPHIGEVFEYTINISGFTTLSDLGNVKDILDPNLDFISSDFNSTSSVFAFYSFWCPSSLGSLTQPAPHTTGTLNFNFPSSCSGTGSGSLSFKIKVALKASACPSSITTISNVVKLYNQSALNTATSSPCIITVNKTNPWVLNKTYRSSTGGFLIYDVRLTSTVGEYNMNVLPSVQFLDSFTTSTCINAGITGSVVNYIPEESTPGVYTTVSTATSTIPGMNFNWTLPTSSSGNTLPSYLFQVKIKTGACTCTSTSFNLLNYVKANLTDVCGVNTILTDKYDILNSKCLGDTFTNDIAKLCVTKEVKLDSNKLNLTMSGCTGNYVITIKNCTNTYNYDNIKLSDIFPSSSLLNIIPSGISISPAIYSADLTATSSSLSFITSTALAPDGIITINIPFTVVTPLPNQVIKNCANIKVKLNDGVSPPTIITRTFCDAGIKTVPNEVTLVTTKKLCTTSTHSCGGFTTNNFLPGDEVEYALHVYNYGTTDATNVTITDNLPAFLSTTSANIKVYKITNYGNAVNDICDVSPSSYTRPGTTLSALSEVTTTSTVGLTGNTISVNLLSNKLDKFTCTGITHYIIKVKAKIAINAPNGSYTNVFQTKYKNAGTGVFNTQISNPVTLVVNKDALVFTKKTFNLVNQDCVNKTAKVDYEVWAINMGYTPITLFVKDVLTVPAGLPIISGINAPGNLQYELCNPVCGTSIPLVSSGSMTVTSTTNSFNVNQFSLAPCTLLKIKYSVTFNTNSINAGQIAKVCNNATVTAGYMGKFIIDKGWVVLPDLTLYKDPVLINKFFESNNETEKLNIAEQMKSEMNSESKSRALKKPLPTDPTGPIYLPLKFYPLDTMNIEKCDTITDCLNGSSKGCFTSNGTGSFIFKINNINSTGLVNTTLSIPVTSSKIRKIEYVLSDIRMLNNPPCKFCCSQTVLGNFTTTTPIVHAPLVNTSPAPPAFGLFKELNKVEFSNTAFMPLVGTFNPQFKLPVSLNCNGNLEIVITCIIYFEDCSICYQSQAFDYHSTYTWVWPDYSTIEFKKQIAF